MNPSTLLTLLFTLSLIFISDAARLPAPILESTKLYQIVCADAESNTNRCLKFLGSYPEITSAKNYLVLCRHLLEIAIDKSTKSHDYFIGAMKKNPSSPAIKECALSFYNGTVNSFKSALGELVESPDTANYDAKVAGDGAVDCNQALMDEKITDPTLANLNNEASFISLVAFLATNHLPPDPPIN